MKSMIIKELPVEVNLPLLMKKMNMNQDSPVYLEYLNAVDLINDRIKPKSILKVCSVEAVSKHMVIIDGVKFKSKTLHYLLRNHQWVFLYLLTIGEMPTNLHHLEHYFINSLKLPMMYGAMKHLKQVIREEYHFEQVGIVNPGLIQDWAIQDSKAIYDSFGDSAEKIGIHMSSNGIMHPIYSSSGILFEDFHNYCDCTVCNIDGCIARESARIDTKGKLASH